MYLAGLVILLLCFVTERKALKRVVRRVSGETTAHSLLRGLLGQSLRGQIHCG